MNDKQAMHTVAFPAITSLNKGLGHLERPVASGEIASLAWNLLAEDLSLPSAVLYEDRLLHNLNWMQQFIAAYGVKLAPHGKTTMAPQLFNLQMQAGAWGITLANAHQTFVAYEHGIRRVLMANQLIGKENMAIISRLLRDQSFDYYCLVDSAAQVDQLGAFFSQSGQRLQVLLELGAMGGRTGARDEAQLQAVLEAMARWSDSIALCGVEMYEGVLAEEEAIRAFLHRAVAVTRTLAEEKRFERTPALLSGAGSAWYDVVAEVFSAAGFGDSVEIVLRPGCYLTHDVGAYREAQTQIQQRNPIAHRMRSGLLPALHVWAYVQSVPEPEKAIIAMGKRDAAFDAGLPAPALHFRPGAVVPKAAPAHWTLTKMMDQHAYLQIAEGDDLRVGDMIGFDISHPCLTFDKWRSLLVLNAEYQVVDAVQTFF
ncbi:amino acid deaminase [Granulicella mallensis]|uniref:Alanine racemase domain protein n=1 Tax=Granulicella mallensis (strain ATCC BAA-1857 / DSM 23137 / MP5ACTX8) TaxID=682795 RepID=G8NW67_GRAMM|nr:amino acid deaminase [Granulicella mallensis]AEU36579.1 alanine racemase domain protein [Granulicella mallensis MP5ACTX8]